jgi:hypothetical protein
MATKKATTRTDSTQPIPNQCYRFNIGQFTRITTEKGTEWAVPGDSLLDFPGGRRVLVHCIDLTEANGLFPPTEWVEPETGHPKEDDWFRMYQPIDPGPYERNPNSISDGTDYKNALELDKFLRRRLGLSDVHIGYIMDALKRTRLSGPDYQVTEIRRAAKASKQASAAPARKSA